MSFTVTPTGAALGAFVSDIRLSEIGAAEGRGLIEALGEHGVLFFRGQELSPAEHIAFARSLGEIDTNAFFAPNEDFPEIAEVRTRPENAYVIGEAWHTDHSYETAPALGSILVARRLPSRGGDTAFSSMYAAYEALSDGMKATLGGLRAVHSSYEAFGVGLSKLPESERNERFKDSYPFGPDVVHPVVISHPVSGRAALYVNRSFTTRFDEWTVHESRPLLEFLFEHGASVEFTYRFRWAPGSVAIWDNRCTWHKALNDYRGESRLMHRITLKGCALAA
ncbi:TauD/TfdA dioxygenase family protein [Candidatus Poriferisodalis sp.]|uniref:TauD/TfdA dioxygenase family protein n=1 Tax=Candidatus Poriferisodalis sp. TaxID=3101277 RepID=UPI003B0218A2